MLVLSPHSPEHCDTAGHRNLAVAMSSGSFPPSSSRH